MTWVFWCFIAVMAALFIFWIWWGVNIVTPRDEEKKDRSRP